MARDLTKSNAHWKKAVTRLPLGVASNFRYWGEEKTIYVKEGKGARITDIDGNRYVDYRLGYGPAILEALLHRAIGQFARDQSTILVGIVFGGSFGIRLHRHPVLGIATHIPTGAEQHSAPG